MKEIFKDKKFRLIIFIMALYSIFFCIEEVLYKNLVSESIDGYIKAQGLKNQEIIDDSGIEQNIILAIMYRHIIFSNNPKQIYEYSTVGRYYDNFVSLIPFYNVFRYTIDKNNFGNISFVIRTPDGYGLVDTVDGIYEGELDKNGKLLKEIPWTINKK